MLAYLFVVLAIAVRFAIPYTHFWHFTPVGASLLFFGAKQPRKLMWLPVGLLAASDIALNLFVYHYPVTLSTFSSTLWYALAVVIGWLLREKHDILRVGAASLAGSASFFVISNFAVWALGTMYTRDLAGLATCYVAAIPFFGSTVTSDMIYTQAFFLAPVFVEVLRRKLQGSGNEAAA